MVQCLLTSSAVGRCEKQGGGGVVLVRQKNGGYLNRANSSCLMLKRGKFEGMIFANDCFFLSNLKKLASRFIIIPGRNWAPSLKFRMASLW